MAALVVLHGHSSGWASRGVRNDGFESASAGVEFIPFAAILTVA